MTYEQARCSHPTQVFAFLCTKLTPGFEEAERGWAATDAFLISVQGNADEDEAKGVWDAWNDRGI